jgi:6-phosphofructokinase 1
MNMRGNAVVGQSGGPTAAINATLAGVIKGALGCDKINTLWGMRNGIEGLMEERFIDLGECFKSLENIEDLALTPAAALGSCRRKLPAPDSTKAEDIAVYEKILSVFKKYDIRYFFYIGGNDSMDTVSKLSRYALLHPEYEFVAIGVPKTIDNDLSGTDHAPGYGSAAKFIATVMQEIMHDCAVYTIPAVTIVEIMGRDAGWLTAAAGVGAAAGGYSPDGIYLPECVFSMEEFFDNIEKSFKKHPNLVIAVSEGIRFADGRYVGEGINSSSRDAFGHVRLSGAGKVLEAAVKERFGCKVRSVELNLPQRCAGHLLSATDINEALAIGEAAVKCAAQGEGGKMMTFERVSASPYKCEISSKNVFDIANAVSEVPEDFINAEKNGITEKCVEYILPLILGEVSPKFDKGIPQYIKL